MREVWFAAAGALLALALGLVDRNDVVSLGRETGGVLLFLLGMLVVAALADRAGVFHRMADWVGGVAGGRGRRLFAGIYGIGVLVTMWLSLDTTAVILAPIVYSLVRSLGVPPLPFVFATTYVANTASLFLPVSNLTNLIVFGRLDIPFWEYARIMLLPSVLAVAVNLGTLIWVFRRSIPVRYDAGPHHAERVESGEAGGREAFAVTTCVLAFTLLALAVAPFWEVELWLVACAGAAVLAAYHLTIAGLSVREFLAGVSWDLFPFVFSLFLILRGVAGAGLAEWSANAVSTWAAGESFWELLAVASATAFGSNLINNLPMILIATESLTLPVSSGELGLASMYAALIGTNLGPNLTVIGSLATMLSLSIISKKGLRVPAITYLGIGLICVPLMLVAAVFGLWLSL